MSFRIGSYWQLTILISCWLPLVRVARALDVNVTVDDTHPSIFYLPADAWQSACTSCQGSVSTSDLAQNSSYHIVRDSSQPRSGSSRRSDVLERAEGSRLRRRWKGSTLLHSAKGLADVHDTQEQADSLSATDDYDNDDQHTTTFDSTGALRTRPSFLSTTHSRNLLKRETHDQRDSISPEVTLKFDFTGSAIFLFGINPPSSEEAPSDQPSLRPIFKIDGSSYQGQPTREQSSSTDRPDSVVTLFAQTNLQEGPHELTITLHADSGFIFDYLIYTQDRNPQVLFAESQSADASPSGSASVPSPTTDQDKKRNVTTFAAAVGGSVGVLAILSAGLAISIMRRRYLAAKREREDLENNPHDPERIRQQQMAMAGPDTFIPRFFPGTEIIPPDSPPTYNDTVSTPPLPNHIMYPYLHAIHTPYLHHPHNRGMSSPSELSYADIPPDTPPLNQELELPQPPGDHDVMPPGIHSSAPPPTFDDTMRMPPTPERSTFLGASLSRRVGNEPPQTRSDNDLSRMGVAPMDPNSGTEIAMAVEPAHLLHIPAASISRSHSASPDHHNYHNR
ncbi:hypothetical protein FA15DRAFT_702377 [Coprinopsis marcescibilis]|uniref:Mid2 domain-containing protein n=1 Tax=Coprinopsis marcescibilis TaxID=230819 RepID=A0A5C3L2K0_COPMA|nr:hypothetical protein FA15DRAFT_702377 [Coprinopsis marcescibilis]